MTGTQRALDDGLRLAVDAIGGLQSVGHLLRPEMHPILAGQWLAHCLDPGRREKLSGAQIALVFARAKIAGKHDGFVAFAESPGYRVTAVIDPKDEIADLARRATQHAQAATDLSAEALERMRHAGIKVDV